jgi:WD40 repeat protein
VQPSAKRCARAIRCKAAVKGEKAPVRTWDLAINKVARVVEFEGRRYSEARDATLNFDGTRVAWMGFNGTEVQIADTAKGRERKTLSVDSYGTSRAGMAFSPDGQSLAIGIHRSPLAGAAAALFLPGQLTSKYLLEEVAASYIAVFQVPTGKQLLTLPGHRGFVVGLAFSPHGERLVAVGGNGPPGPMCAHAFRPPFGEVTVWEASTAGTPLVLQTSVKKCGPMAFSADSQRLLLVERAEPVWDPITNRMIPPKTDLEVWDVQSGLQVMGDAPAQRPPDRTWSADKRRYVELDNKEMQGGVKIVDATTGHVVEARTQSAFSLNLWHNAIMEAAFSPDGTRVAGACVNGTVFVWNTRSGAEVMRIQGHFSTVASVAFSPDGTRLVSGSSDGTAKLWNTATGQEILTLPGAGEPVVRVAFSPDGNRIAAASDGTVRVWDATPLPEEPDGNVVSDKK